MKPVWMRLTPEERMLIHSRRAIALTGYAVHELYDGYYVWSMGKQPDEATRRYLTRPTPIEAALHFLDNYLPKPEADRWTPYALPIHRLQLRVENW